MARKKNRKKSPARRRRRRAGQSTSALGAIFLEQWERTPFSDLALSTKHWTDMAIEASRGGAALCSTRQEQARSLDSSERRALAAWGLVSDAPPELVAEKKLAERFTQKARANLYESCRIGNPPAVKSEGGGFFKRLFG